ncbi:MAG: DUF4394 domain-containing protein, partial [Alphaproteobacteria bacterium]|nr:DUF4394 domain-containing protein [Alphaproteobacteria bacterium]
MLLRTIAGTLLAATALAGVARAETVVALVGDRTLAIVDTGAGKVTRTTTVSGIKGRLAGIDVRPADGMLYGVVEDGTVVTIDAGSGKAT